MGVLRAIGNFFAHLMMGAFISIIFLSLLMTNMLNSTEKMDKMILEESQKYIAENKEDIKASLLENNEMMNIKKEQIAAACASKQIELSEEFCKKLDTMTEQQAKEQFIDESLNTEAAQGYLDTQMSGFADQAKAQVAGAIQPIKETVGSPTMYLVIGIIGYLLTIGAVFALNRFDVKESLYKASRNTFFNTLPFVAVFGYVAVLTPTTVLDAVTKVAGQAGTQLTQLPKALVEMLMTIALSIIKTATNPLLTMAIVAAALSLALAITFKILIMKRAKAPTPKR